MRGCCQEYTGQFIYSSTVIGFSRIPIMPNEHKHTKPRGGTGRLENKGGFTSSFIFLFITPQATVPIRGYNTDLIRQRICQVTLIPTDSFQHRKRALHTGTRVKHWYLRSRTHMSTVSSQGLLTMCYLLAYSCYCFFQESFYKELAVALLRVVRHGRGGDCGGAVQCQIQGSTTNERTGGSECLA